MIYTFAGDGSSDVVLIPVLTWSLRLHGVSPILAQRVDFSRIPRAHGLEQRLRLAIELYPCDVLFVHRDAEGQDPALRRAEIAEALGHGPVRHVPVIPVRMTEAWLLGNQPAIRAAAGNPNGTEDLNLPELRRIELIPDPKQVLHEAIRRASGLNVRRRSRLPVSARVHRIPDYIDDFEYLNALPAFRDLQVDIRRLIGGG